MPTIADSAPLIGPNHHQPRAAGGTLRGAGSSVSSMRSAINPTSTANTRARA